MPFTRKVLLIALSLYCLTIGGLLMGQQGVPASEIAKTRQEGNHFTIGNPTVEASWTVSGDRLSNLTLVDRLHREAISEEIPFALLMKNGTRYDPSNMQVICQPVEQNIEPQNGAARLADTLHGKAFNIGFESTDHHVKANWSMVLIDGSHYLREFVDITAVDQDAAIQRVELIDVNLPDAYVAGSVDGSPIVSRNVYLGFEQPLSQSKVTAGRATAWMNRTLPLKMGQSISYTAVFGVATDGQLRRDFLTYVERERAHPYRTFLHYNSWYDLGYFTPYDSADAVDRINAFGTELRKKRGVSLDSFLFDDGWDNHKSLWQFNAGFPNGFREVKQAAAAYATSPGVWMSPWGGYSKPKQERIAFGKESGYEIVSNGYALSGPKYYGAFRDVCLDMIRVYGINQFKFDGTGNVNSVFPGSSFDSDFSAAIHLIGELREKKPDIYINLTTGTWPSPFWLTYADSIWRGGEDDDFAGVGTYRERWITYRDADTYQRIVQAGPLFPLNSLMLHGLIFAKMHKHLNDDPGNDFRNEIRSYFGTGTQLQEMYITPSLLSQQNWDDLAESAKWSRSNAETLKDTHWVGGDPAWLEVYGWASWSSTKGILTLRNPSDKPQSIELSLNKTLELPAGSPVVFVARSPWKSDAGRSAVHIAALKPHRYDLKPFEVLTLEFTPQ
jgi:hypothetical protein